MRNIFLRCNLYVSIYIYYILYTIYYILYILYILYTSIDDCVLYMLMNQCNLRLFVTAYLYFIQLSIKFTFNNDA